MRRFGIGMRWWLAATFAAIAAVTAVAVYSVSYSRTERALRERTEDFAVGTAVFAAEEVGDALATRNLRGRVREVERSRRISLFVFDRFGQLVTPRRSRKIELRTIDSRNEALASALTSERYVTSEPDTDATVVALPIPENDGVLLAYVSRPDLAAQLGIVRRKVVEAAFIGIGVGTLAGLLVAVLIAARLRRILGAAEAIEAGNFGIRLRPVFRDELGALARTIDRMRQRLQVSFAELESQRDRLQRLLERLHDGVISVGADRRVIYTNTTARRLLSAPDLSEGDELPEPWPGFSLRDFASQLLRTGAEPRQEVFAPDAERTFVLAGIPAGPESDVAVIVVTDVSERERRERAEREFVTNAAHELRTPLTTISGAVQILQSGAKDVPEERDRFLGHIEREAARLGRLTRALLVLARAQTGAEPPMLEPVELRPLLEEVAANVTPREHVEVAVRCPAGLAALADPDLIEQAVWNLAANALEHTDRGLVVLSARRLRNGAVAVDVADTGSGIPGAEQERVFDRFYRGRRRDGRGFGLGLAIVAEAARALHGEVDIDSTPGAGTRVRLTLPGAESKAA